MVRRQKEAEMAKNNSIKEMIRKQKMDAEERKAMVSMMIFEIFRSKWKKDWQLVTVLLTVSLKKTRNVRRQSKKLLPQKRRNTILSRDFKIPQTFKSKLMRTSKVPLMVRYPLSNQRLNLGLAPNLRTAPKWVTPEDSHVETCADISCFKF